MCHKTTATTPRSAETSIIRHEVNIAIDKHTPKARHKHKVKLNTTQHSCPGWQHTSQADNSGELEGNLRPLFQVATRAQQAKSPSRELTDGIKAVPILGELSHHTSRQVSGPPLPFLAYLQQLFFLKISVKTTPSGSPPPSR